MKIIDRILKFLYGSLFFITPLIFTSNTSELFEFNKMIFIYFITVLIAFFWISKMILAKKIIFRKTFLDIPILLFFISQIVSFYFSIDRHVSLFGYYGRFNGGLISILSYIILFYGFVSNSINFENILKTSLVSSFLVMLYGLPGKLGHDITCFIVTKGANFDNSCWDNASLQFQPEIRTFSTLGQPNWLGAYLAINFFIGLFFMIKNSKNTKYLILNTLYLFYNFSFILFSRSRSALAAVIIGIILIAVYYLLTIKKDVKKLTFVMIFTTIVPILIFKTGIEKLDKFIKSPISIFQQVKTTPNPISKSQVLDSGVTESLDIRKIVWKGAIDLGLKYPYFGTGIETFAYSYNFVRPIEHNLTSEWDYVYNKAHNEFFNYLATTGFIGLGSYLLVIGFTVYLFIIKILKNKSKITIYPFLLVSYLTILITNFFGFSTTTINLFFYLIPVVIIMSEFKETENNKNYLKRLNIYQYLIFFITTIISIYLIFSIYSYWLADTYYALGVNYSKPQISDYQKAASLYEQALKLRYEPVYEDRLSSSLSYLSVIASYQKQNEIAKQLMALGDHYNKRTIVKSSKNIFYWKTRAKNLYLFYEVTSDPKYLNDGISSLNEAKKLAPTDPKVNYSLAVYYSMLYDIEKNFTQKEMWKDKSIEEIEKSLMLKRDFQDGLTLKNELQIKYQ